MTINLHWPAWATNALLTGGLLVIAGAGALYLKGDGRTREEREQAIIQKKQAGEVAFVTTSLLNLQGTMFYLDSLFLGDGNVKWRLRKTQEDK